jgi:hypothetical protein
MAPLRVGPGKVIELAVKTLQWQSLVVAVSEGETGGWRCGIKDETVRLCRERAREILRYWPPSAA